MKIGLIGLQNSGKTKLFSSLSSTGEEKGSIKTVKVPDKRLDELTKIFNPKKNGIRHIRNNRFAWLGTFIRGKIKNNERFSK
jgi:ribosome-binding ATPase YchF (GTP1/OBG family)